VRLNTADLLKGVAVILMVQVHITELFIEPSFAITQVGRISLFLGGVPAAPLFMILMGFFITLYQKPFSANIKRGIKLLIWGLLLNLGMNFNLLLNVFFNHWKVDPLPYIFGVDILFLAGFSVILITCLNHLFQRNPLILALLAFLPAVLSDLMPIYQGDSEFMRYLLGYVISHDSWSYFPLLPWLGYSIIGASAGIVFNDYERILIKRSFLVVIPIALVILFWNYGFNISVNLFAYYHHGFQFFLWALMFIIVLVAAAWFYDQSIPDTNFIKKYLMWTGRNVTAFYVFQWLIIGNIATYVYKNESPLLLPVWLTSILVITSLLVLLYKKVKLKMKSVKELSKQLKHV